MPATILHCLFLLVLAFLPGPLNAQDAGWKDIQMLLEDRCVACHSTEDAPLGLQLDSFEGLQAGSENGPVVAPGDPEGSEIVRRITGVSEPSMPLAGDPLGTEEIAMIVDWITAGANGPAEFQTVSTPEPVDPRADGMITYSEVKPIFARNCIECHSDNSKYDEPPEGLRLDSLGSILSGNERLVLVPGNPEASEIIRRVVGLSTPKMPFDGDWLSDEQITLLSDWIAGGAMDDEGHAAPVPVGGRIRIRGTMTGPNEIDGAGFAVTGSSDIRDRLSVGDAAELRARIGADGGLVASRLRER